MQAAAGKHLWTTRSAVRSSPPASLSSTAHSQQHAHGQQQQQQQRGRREDENSVVVRGTRYTKLECVGRGGSSKVGFFTVLIMLSTHQ